MGERVLVISDTQFPFHHEDTFDFLDWVKSKYRPTRIVHIGDEVDFHAMGDWDRDPDGYSAGHELEAALVSMETLYNMFPKCDVMISNHTARPFRKAFKHGFPRAFMRDYHEFLKAPDGWTWHERIEIDGIIYEHGEGASGKLGAITKALNNMQSTVIGHLHSHAGVLWVANKKHLLFGMNVGCLVDDKAYAFAYGKHHPHKPIIGCGVVLDGIPQFIPMVLKSNHRWDRKQMGKKK